MPLYARRALLGLLAWGATGMTAWAQAQEWPNKPIKVIITFTAGSSTDIVGRVVTQRLSEVWGQPVVVDNKPGAGGSIGSAMVAKSAADGYTILINSNAHAVNPAMYANLPYDTKKDFIDIAPLAIQPNVLVVAPDSKFNSVQDTLDFARKNPGVINWGHAGVGSGTHLSTEKMLTSSGVKVTQVPFKGTPEVVAAVMSKSVDAYWGPISAVIANIRGGKLKALAVSTPKRSGTLPEVPTLEESGIKNAASPLWFGMWVPTGTPNEVVQKISRDTLKVLAEPAVVKRLTDLGNDLMPMNPQEFSRYVDSEIAEYDRVFRAAGIERR
ncbi:MAG: tripartite tricarboxylate transporter substrate binding protein [Alphaproteobacteria bacterium]|nr:tripartite tricarboxylate transporter substrate binding protein [Alphaproteobacteria bacterium]